MPKTNSILSYFIAGIGYGSIPSKSIPASAKSRAVSSGGMLLRRTLEFGMPGRVFQLYLDASKDILGQGFFEVIKSTEFVDLEKFGYTKLSTEHGPSF